MLNLITHKKLELSTLTPQVTVGSIISEIYHTYQIPSQKRIATSLHTTHQQNTISCRHIPWSRDLNHNTRNKTGATQDNKIVKHSLCIFPKTPSQSFTTLHSHPGSSQHHNSASLLSSLPSSPSQRHHKEKVFFIPSYHSTNVAHSFSIITKTLPYIFMCSVCVSWRCVVPLTVRLYIFCRCHRDRSFLHYST